MLLVPVASGLTAKAVKGASLPLEGVDHVHGGDGLPLGMLGVGDSVTDYILQKYLLYNRRQSPSPVSLWTVTLCEIMAKNYLENAPSLLVDETGDALHSATTCQTTDGGLRNALDVITQNLPVALGASFSQTLSTFSAASHDSLVDLNSRKAAKTQQNSTDFFELSEKKSNPYTMTFLLLLCVELSFSIK